jgi:hypothetical protein
LWRSCTKHLCKASVSFQRYRNCPDGKFPVTVSGKHGWVSLVLGRAPCSEMSGGHMHSSAPVNCRFHYTTTYTESVPLCYVGAHAWRVRCCNRSSCHAAGGPSTQIRTTQPAPSTSCAGRLLFSGAATAGMSAATRAGLRTAASSGTGVHEPRCILLCCGARQLAQIGGAKSSHVPERMRMFSDTPPPCVPGVPCSRT